MKADVFLVLACFLVIYLAWVVTGGPNRPISKAGPYITPVTRSGEESQGYRVTPPTNPLSPGAYPRQVGGATQVISRPDPGARTSSGADNTASPSSGSMDLYAN